MKRSLLILALFPAAVAAQTKANPLKYPAKPTTAAITPADLMSRLYGFADDSMNGRNAGTAYHDKGTDYIARELTRLGLKPGGDNGTFFQGIPLIKRVLVAGGKVTADGREFVAGKDFLPRNPSDFGAIGREPVNAPVVWAGIFGDTATMIKPNLVEGKVLIFGVPRGWQANRGGMTQFYATAAAVVVATLDSMPEAVKAQLGEAAPLMGGQSFPICNPQTLQGCPVPSFFYATRAMAEAMLGAPLTSATIGTVGKTVTTAYKYSDEKLPGNRNVVAVLPGTDTKLKGQYVAIGAHSDHVQPGAGGAAGDYDLPIDHDSVWAFYRVVRPNGADDDNKPPTAEHWPQIRAKLDSIRKVRSPRMDSIYNGADDDGSGSMSLLEIAEAFATSRDKPKRSLLFVWHVGEELGLYGADYFTDHPTVPRDSITSQINLDMIGRGGAQDMAGGGPGYLQLIGSKRLSTELGDLVETEARKFTAVPFKFDYQYDANGHPQQFYCRSDHERYARYGIPVVFMSTGGHPDYHQITDEPQYIDYDQLTRVSQFVFNLSKTIANMDHRLVVDKPKPDPTAPCRQ